MGFQARITVLALAGSLLNPAVSRAQEPEPPVTTESGREVGADGTVSVVVKPPIDPPAAEVFENPSPAAPEAATLLGELLTPLDAPAAQGLHERPLPLLEALERSGDRSRRLWITQAYWKVVGAFAGLRQALMAVERLDLVAPGADARDRAVLDTLAAEAQAAQSEARAALVAAQQELVDLVRNPMGEALPWPIDRPLVITYQTHFETIFATRAATGRVRAINRALPLRHAVIESRASAARLAAAAFSLVEQDHARGLAPIEAVAAAAERLSTQERAFIEDVLTYNNEIAEYVMAVADFSVPDDRFAAMLIGTPTPWRQPPVVVAAGATAEAPRPPPQASPTPAVPPPVFIPPAGLVPTPPGQPVVP